MSLFESAAKALADKPFWQPGEKIQLWWNHNQQSPTFAFLERHGGYVTVLGRPITAATLSKSATHDRL